ncbi:MAG TPA: hypothetical protein C5S37_09535 [Methanophagales archaeon]|nr:hypothetical protein [Methanophagales archaeon]
MEHEIKKFAAVLCAALVLVAISIPFASAYTDCMVDRTRTQQGFSNPTTLPYIIDRLDEAHNYIWTIFWVHGVADYSYSNSDHDFINHINGLDPDTNIVLVHCHGGTSGSSSYLKFKDGSKLYDNEVNDWLDWGGYFIFAGACKSAKYTDLGNAFVNRGFDTFFGYKETVYTKRNGRFYSAFFYKGRYLDTPVSIAANYAEDKVEEEFGDASDVGNNRFIGDSSLCLAPSDW